MSEKSNFQNRMIYHYWFWVHESLLFNILSMILLSFQCGQTFLVLHCVLEIGMLLIGIHTKKIY